MATPAQIAANQANAQHSTGPRSVEGKARSSRNNFRHGFRSQSVLLPGDDPAEFQALPDELTEHFEAEDLTEQRQVREMADAEWRLRRVREYQEVLLARKIDALAPLHPDTDPIALQALAFDALHRESSSFAQLLRYETKYERQYNTAYNQWGAYQQQLDIKRRRDAETGLLAYLNAPLPDEFKSKPSPAAEPAPEAAPEIPRNAPCPCGSGQKYKRCCGKDAPPVLNACPAAA